MQHLHALLFVAALLTLEVVASHFGPTRSSLSIPPSPVPGNSTVEFVVNSKAWDGPYADFYNASVYQWWYFDAISDDLSSAVWLESFANAPAGLGSLNTGSPFNMVLLVALLPNGTIYTDYGVGSTFTITTEGQGSSGYLNGSGYSWTGSPDLSHYRVDVDVPAVGLKGTIDLQSTAPAHAVCGPMVEGAGLTLNNTRFGWFNAIPDANAYADFTFGGDLKVSYSGPGYHDIDWSDVPYYTSLSQWYWGHGRVGTYSLVWFDYIDATGVESVSGYVTKDGRVVSDKCSGLSVRPTGTNSTYPPVPGQGDPSGFHMEFDLGSEGVLSVEVSNKAVSFAVPDLYTRWIGTLNGTVNGGRTMNGVGLYEWQRAVV